MKILIAEDEGHMAAVLKRALISKSIAADVATDGEQAFAMASMSQYDVILLDIVMPKMQGVDVCQQLRKKGIKTPIIMLSGRGAVPDKIRGLDSGADDYLPKPFSFSELMARIRAHTRRTETFSRPELKFQDLAIDRNTRKVKRAGKEIDLSPKEYRVLEFLMKHQGKVMSRFEILENVWGSAESNLSNVVDVHVSHLRRKIDAGSKMPLLKTVRGGGYVLE